MMMQRDLAQLGIAVAEDLVSGAQHVLALRKFCALPANRQPSFRTAYGRCRRCPPAVLCF